MLSKIGMWIFKGLLTILPIALTFYLLYWLVVGTENWVRQFFPDAYYFPGVGLLSVIIGLATLGALVNAYLVRFLLIKLNTYLDSVPLIKTLYGAIKDGVELFQIQQGKPSKKAVLVELFPGNHALGFITNPHLADKIIPNEGKVAVYFPMSYQVGGYTLYVSSERVKDLSISVEQAMRITVTGGASLK